MDAKNDAGKLMQHLPLMFLPEEFIPEKMQDGGDDVQHHAQIQHHLWLIDDIILVTTATTGDGVLLSTQCSFQHRESLFSRIFAYFVFYLQA